MERRKFTEDQAFTELSRASQNTNIRLRGGADELVRTRRTSCQNTDGSLARLRIIGAALRAGWNARNLRQV